MNILLRCTHGLIKINMNTDATYVLMVCAAFAAALKTSSFKLKNVTLISIDCSLEKTVVVSWRAISFGLLGEKWEKGPTTSSQSS